MRTWCSSSGCCTARPVDSPALGSRVAAAKWSPPHEAGRLAGRQASRLVRVSVRHGPRLGCRPGWQACAAPHADTRHAAPDDEAALHVLGAASRALAAGGSLIIVEPLLAEGGGGGGGGGGHGATRGGGSGGGHAYLEDLSLMVVGGGRDRTRREWTDLFERAGLELVGVHPAAVGGSTLCGLGVLVARKRRS
eukprot:scaffold81991_cov72-Phaeocystis_antarctica.AAC.8